ncbi:hypothetical protein BKA81DRAFT_362913 [Phyllosticta paracitricarpa]
MLLDYAGLQHFLKVKLSACVSGASIDEGRCVRTRSTHKADRVRAGRIHQSSCVLIGSIQF